jgi:hypothetical protein
MKLFFLSIAIVLLAASHGYCDTDPNQLPYESFKVVATKDGKEKLPEWKELRINALNETTENVDITLHLGSQEPDLKNAKKPYLLNFITDHTEQLTVDAFPGFDFSNNNPVELYCYAACILDSDSPFSCFSRPKRAVAQDQDGNTYSKSFGGHLALCNMKGLWKIYPIAQGKETLTFFSYTKFAKQVTVTIHVLPPFQPKTDLPVSSASNSQ